jgi:hypothetical protein
MSQVYNYQNRSEYTAGKPNTVLKSTHMEWEAVQVALADGKVSVCFAAYFGKDAKTGKPQIAIMNWDKISELFVECPKSIYEQLAARWEARQVQRSNEGTIPEPNLGTILAEDLP